ncbi:DUF2185 domain-containing protein [Tenacibaculum sp. TC6]|uniref:DUF2185 domain-containing protein n=1 Tax=Tenacibaculum sp. TC6 TaxID=3423223 RepID=UPI003D363A37
MTKKSYKLKAEEILEIEPNRGACFATDRITVDGQKIGYMYRETPTRNIDSGWRFFAGDETDEYVNDLNNVSIYDINTIVNYDGAIIPFLDAPIGSEFERIEGKNHFVLIDK